MLGRSRNGGCSWTRAGRTVISHRHVRDNLLERRLLPQKALIAPITRLPELIPELLDLAPGCYELAQVPPHWAQRLVGEGSGPV
jgi:hypothetical protein